MLAIVTVLAAMLAWQLDLWRWRLLDTATQGKEFKSLIRLLLWFGWPAWPMAAWTLWRWRKQLFNRQVHRHLWLPPVVLNCFGGRHAHHTTGRPGLLVGL